VRLGSGVDAARLARHLAGRAVGLLLAGSGARGLVHLGALRALSDSGVPVDVVGGTGAGALLAAAFARGASHRALLRACTGALTGPFGGAAGRSLFSDFTLPLLSLFTGWGLAQAIQEVLGGTAIEDLWLRFFCTTTNLTRGEMQVHERGGVGRAVRASQSLLGLLPPVTDDVTGDLLADGGYLTSYPVDVMRGRFGVDTVIVVDCAGGERDAANALRSLAPLDGGVSGWRLLWDRLFRLSGPGTAGQPQYETLVAALLAAVQRRQLRQATREHPIDLHIRPSAPARALTTRAEQEALVRAAYKQSLAAIAAWQQQEGASWGSRSDSSSIVLISASSVSSQAAAATQRWVSEDARARVRTTQVGDAFAGGTTGGAVAGTMGGITAPKHPGRTSGWTPAPHSPQIRPPSPRMNGVPISGPLPVRGAGSDMPREAVNALLSRTASAEATAELAKAAAGKAGGSTSDSPSGAGRPPTTPRHHRRANSSTDE
jgi:predicted acylesterase/phospholipase RssA